MNNLFLLPVANTPAEAAPEGQPPVEGPVFAAVLEEVEQAEASKDLEEKTTAAPETLLVAVPSPPAPEPALTPVPAQDEVAETGSEPGGPANSNVEAAAAKQPQASPQPATGWTLPSAAPQPPTTSQAPKPDQQPQSDPGFGKEREYTPIQVPLKQPRPSPDLRADRPPAPPTGHPPADLPPEPALMDASVRPHAGSPVETSVQGQPAIDSKPAAAPAPLVQVSPEKSTPPDVPAQTPLQGSETGVPSSTTVPAGDFDNGGHPTEKIGRSPTFQETQAPGFTQEVGKEAYKPAPTPVMTSPPAPETVSAPPPKVGLRPPEAGAEPFVETGTPDKTAVHGPKQGAETAPRNGPQMPLPVQEGPIPMTVFVKEQPANQPAPVSIERPTDQNQAPVFNDLALEPRESSGTPAAEAQVVREPVLPRFIPAAQDQPGPTASLPVQQFADPQGTTSADTAPEAIIPAPAEEAPADRSQDPLLRQKAAYQAVISNERAAAPQAGQPVRLEQTNQTLPTQTLPQAPLDQPVAQARPVVDAPVPSPETRQPSVVDGPHLEQPGEPSTMPEIKTHLHQEQAQIAHTREAQTQPNPWPAFGRAQAEISAGPSGTGRVLTHPLTSKTEAYPVNAPAETIFPSETAKLPQTDIPVNEMPKPAPVQIPQPSIEKVMGEEFAGKATQQLASGPVEELVDTKAGVRKTDSGRTKAADPPKLEHSLRGDVGLNPNVTQVEVPQPVSEPARLAEAQASRIIKQLQDNILRASQAGHTSLHLQLHPKDLGQIDLELTSQMDGLRITFTPDNPETGKLLAFHLKELQQSLTEAGVQISGLFIGQDQAKGAPRHETRRNGKSRGAPTAQAGNELKISGENAGDTGPTGWSSAVNYQI